MTIWTMAHFYIAHFKSDNQDVIEALIQDIVNIFRGSVEIAKCCASSLRCSAKSSAATFSCRLFVGLSVFIFVFSNWKTCFIGLRWGGWLAHWRVRLKEELSSQFCNVWLSTEYNPAHLRILSATSVSSHQGGLNGLERTGTGRNSILAPSINEPLNLIGRLLHIAAEWVHLFVCCSLVLPPVTTSRYFLNNKKIIACSVGN